MSEPKTERNAKIIAAYKTGQYSLREIAAAFDITHQRVDDILRSNGIPKNPPYLNLSRKGNVDDQV